MIGRTEIKRLLTGIAIVALASLAPSANAQAKQPNILVIMADDIGWFNIGVYNQGIMAGRTPQLDKMAAEG
ncbi:MAG TPA: arylsulfatase, partial [Candidatus Angelobacter sp.]|nr:arylsulfatase [Candidatus Angelobacter sp.]